VILKRDKRVLGMHIASPNAGEIIQGFAVAFRKGGLTHQDLLDTVGIHPTIAEEFCLLTTVKAAGRDIFINHSVLGVK
jgi:pyruvate/2-oxoglutarate dehydrogenase complex dihydrolipoamide dehydrogenase (E3) component